MTMLTDENGINERRFRSVLPHEPLPIDGDSKGYAHLQGAFEPKRNKLTNNSNDKKSSTTTTSSSSSLSYWKSPEALEEVLLLALRDDFERLKLPYPVLSVHVTDPNNLSKVRLEYNSPHEAIQIQYAFRDQRISPHDIIILTDEQQQNVVLFGSRPCQATMITDKPLPTDRCFWPRSNPPQFRRLLHDRGDDEKERSETRFVYVTGLIDNNITAELSDWWNNPYYVYQAMRQVFGTDVEIFLPKKINKRQQRIQSCQLGFRSAEEAQDAVQKFQGMVVSWELKNDNISNSTNKNINSGELFLDYATVTKKSKAKQQGEYEKGEASRPDCTSTTDHVYVPGLVVVENFLTEAEEELLVAILTGPQAPWAPQQSNMSQTGSVKRRVQHYGYVFDYRTADVLRRDVEEESGRLDPDANCPPLPSIPVEKGMEKQTNDNDLLVKEGKGWELLAQIIEKTRQHEFDVCSNKSNNSLNNNENADLIDPQPTKKMIFSDLNQMTLNQYKTGEGIGSHVDTPSAFGDGLISISLSSGIVMEFQKVTVGNDDDGNKVSPKNIKKLVYLPRRSLVLMSGACRYEWEHHIVTRRTDTHNGVVIPRGLRVSLTLRTALSLKGIPLPRFESNMFPPVWGINDEKRNGSTMDSNVLVTPNTERDHVHAVYDAIATQWHHTRGKRGVLWPSASLFVKDLPEGSIVADCGCGDGKYFPAVWEAGSYVIGTDISLPLLKTALLNDSASLSDGGKVPDTRRVSPHRESLQKRPAVAVADCMSIPFRNNSCDAAICIAVMHHLSTIDRRIRCIEELARIVKINGKIMIQAWAMGCHSRRRFAAPDVFVPFNAQPKYLDKVSENSKTTMQDFKAGTMNDSNTGVAATSVVPTINGPHASKSAAEIYSDAYDNADFDEQKGLVVFQRYCHMYREGELEDIVSQIPSVKLIDGGFETGNYFVILEVVAN